MGAGCRFPYTSHRMRRMTVLLRPAAATLATVLLALAVPALGGFSTARADIQSGEFSVALNAEPSSVAEGDEATIQVLVEHGGEPNYQAVQWFFTYDVNLIEVVSLEKAAAAPEACVAKNDNGSRVLLGCLDLGGVNISYSGVAFNVRVRCIAGGEAEFVLGDAARTFVKNGPDSRDIHTHNTTLTCGGNPPSETATAVTPPGSTPQPGDTPAPGETPPAGATPPPADTPLPGATVLPGGTIVAGGTAISGTEATQRSGTSTATRRTPSATTTPAADTGDDDDDGDSAVMWIVIGAIVVAAVGAAGGAYYFMNRR